MDWITTFFLFIVDKSHLNATNVILNSQENMSWRKILQTYMRSKNHINVNFVLKVFLNQFMKEKSLSTVVIAIVLLLIGSSWICMWQEFMKKKKPFTCCFCNPNFFENRELKIHIFSVHKGIKPYKCEVCNKSFS